MNKKLKTLIRYGAACAIAAGWLLQMGLLCGRKKGKSDG